MVLQRYLNVNTLKGRKRSRLAGPHDPARPEIKQYNMLSSADRDGYTPVEIYPWVADHISNRPAGALGAWALLPLLAPNEGTGSSERIGKTIYLRGIQLRGYIEIRDTLVFPCNWRLVLYRQKNLVGQGIPAFADLYNNFSNMDLEVGNIYGTLSHYRHNFYQAMYNQTWNDTGTRQVLAKGRVTPVDCDSRSGSCSISTGTYAAPTGSANAINTRWFTRREVHNITVGYEPVKKIIKCNIDHTVTEDFLYLMLETDYPVGVVRTDVATSENYPDATTIDASLNASSVPFKFNIFVRGYFTDP